MELIHPVKRIADEEIFYLIATIVEDERAPVLMLSEAGIFVLEEAGSIEAREAMGILRKVTGHPVEYDADPFLVTAIDKVTELIGISEAARGSVVVHDLISP